MPIFKCILLCVTKLGESVLTSVIKSLQSHRCKSKENPEQQRPLLCLIRYQCVMLVISVYLLSVKRIKSISSLCNCINRILFDLSRHYLTTLLCFFFSSITFTIFPLSAQPETLEEWVRREYAECKICMISETCPLTFMLISYKCICLKIKKKRNVK